MPSLKHGQHKTRTYGIWSQMKARCLNPHTLRFERYGGRGIKLHPAWHNFENFFADMGECPEGATIDRINNDGDYTPENCKWSTPKEQARNRSNSTALTFNGKTATLAEWAEQPSTPPYQTIYARLRSGWSIERALTVIDGRRRQLCHQ